MSNRNMSSDKGKRARHELVQACAAAIIDVLEAYAQNGFKCFLHDIKYVSVPSCVGQCISLAAGVFLRNALEVCLGACL